MYIYKYIIYTPGYLNSEWTFHKPMVPNVLPQKTKTRLTAFHSKTPMFTSPKTRLVVGSGGTGIATAVALSCYSVPQFLPWFIHFYCYHDEITT